MENIIIVAVLALLIGGAALYVYKSRKKGIKCIGCPNGGKCSGHSSGCSCSCGK